MITFDDLHWESINFLKIYLYRRLASPLNTALGRLAIAQHIDDDAASRRQFQRVEQSLEITLNLIKAWAALVHVQSDGQLQDYQRRQIAPDGLPAWLVDHLNTQTGFRVEFSQPLLVHPETFYESLMLVCQLGATVGTLKNLTLGDSQGDPPGIWVRAIFEPPAAGLYTSLKHLRSGLDPENAADRETVFDLAALQAMFEINGARLRLQNNTETGDQALAALIPPAPKHVLKPYPLAALYAAPESADEPPEREPLIDRQAADQDERKVDADVAHEPRLSGPVLAKTPRQVSLPEPGHGDQPTPAPSEHTISGPVLARTPRDTAEATAVPAAKGAPEPDTATPAQAETAAAEALENRPETLPVPPPDRDARMAPVLDAVESAPATGDTPPVDALPDEARPAATGPAAPAPGAESQPHDKPKTGPLPALDAETPSVSQDKTVSPAPDEETEAEEPANLSETLILPPLDFRSRIVKPGIRPDTAETARFEDDNGPEIPGDDAESDDAPAQPAAQE